jgi:hypothetical protein
LYCNNTAQHKELQVTSPNLTPTNIELHKNIKLLNPPCGLDTQNPVDFNDLPVTEFILSGKDRYTYENLWRKIALIDTKTEFVSNNFCCTK